MTYCFRKWSITTWVCYHIFSLTVALQYFLSHQKKLLNLVMSVRYLIMMSHNKTFSTFRTQQLRINVSQICRPHVHTLITSHYDPFTIHFDIKSAEDKYPIVFMFSGF